MVSKCFGIKLGSTRGYHNNELVMLTAVQFLPCKVIRHKTVDTDGYAACVVAVKPKKSRNKAELAVLSESFEEGVNQHLREIRCEDDDCIAVGEVIEIDCLEGIEKVDARAVTKGKGFTGAIARHGFSRQGMSHGNSKAHRAIGSTGQCQDPGKVFKGKKMPGQSGGSYRTAVKIKIVKIDKETNTVFLMGAIPGAKGALVTLKESTRK